ncbi:MAG: YceI family protein [Betaproteobacteria bacterium]|nr:YceI family protein [Betaproteobacteria bacterium]
MTNSVAHRVLIGLFAAASIASHASTYRIEPTETTARFEVHFLGVFPIRGDFRRTSGTLIYDPATRVGNIDVAIDATTLEAGSERAQKTARGEDFFNVDKFSSIDFKSSRFVFEDSKLRAVEGMLTLVGLNKPVVLVVNDSKCEPAREREAAYCRADATLTVKRSDFGMKAWSHTVGDDVVIRIAIVAKQAPDSAIVVPTAAGVNRVEPAKNP